MPLEKLKPCIYVSGPYTAPTDEQIAANVAAAEMYGYRLQALGAVALVPHRAVLKPVAREPRAAWLEAMECCFTMLRVSDAIFMMPNWNHSEGARDEFDASVDWNKPIFHDFDAVQAWLKERA